MYYNCEHFSDEYNNEYGGILYRFCLFLVYKLRTALIIFLNPVDPIYIYISYSLSCNKMYFFILLLAHKFVFLR